MNRKLITYLPQFMQEYEEIEAIMAAEQTDTDSLWNAVYNVRNDQFVSRATDAGLTRFEKIYGLSHRGDDTEADRRFRIVSRMTAKLPYTIDKLQQYLTDMCGPNGYGLTCDNQHYRLTIRIALNKKNQYDTIREYVGEMIPANLIFECGLMYNQHLKFTKRTYGQLAAYTNRQLREDYLEDEE